MIQELLEYYSWLREQHAIAGSINSLYAPSLESRMKLFVINPLFTGTQQTDTVPLETPDQSFSSKAPPLISSTPFGDPGEDSTRHEKTGFTVSRIKELDATAIEEHQPVDMIVENPIFGSGLSLKKVVLSHNSM